MNTKHCLGIAFAAWLPFGAAHGAASTPQKEVVASKDAPAAVGPYSQAIRSGGMVFLANVVSTTVYVKDLNDFAKLNAVYATYFKDKPPARATVQVQRLPKDAAVEISAIAVH